MGKRTSRLPAFRRRDHQKTWHAAHSLCNLNPLGVCNNSSWRGEKRKRRRRILSIWKCCRKRREGERNPPGMTYGPKRLSKRSKQPQPRLLQQTTLRLVVLLVDDVGSRPWFRSGWIGRTGRRLVHGPLGRFVVTLFRPLPVGMSLKAGGALGLYGHPATVQLLATASPYDGGSVHPSRHVIPYRISVTRSAIVGLFPPSFSFKTPCKKTKR